MKIERKISMKENSPFVCVRLCVCVRFSVVFIVAVVGADAASLLFGIQMCAVYTSIWLTFAYIKFTRCLLLVLEATVALQTSTHTRTHAHMQ